MTGWTEDILQDPYEQLTLDLGTDPDGEGAIRATLGRRRFEGEPRAAVIYVHGFSDYFFQTELAEFYADRGYAFYSLDLRKCGRSLDQGQTPHFVSDLAFYDAELDEALRIVRSEVPDVPIVLSAHSTGGLVLPLWLDRMNLLPGGTRARGIAGLVLNSPWFDLQGPAWMRTVGTTVVRGVAKARPLDRMKLPFTDSYGASLHSSRGGQWDYDIAWKPLEGFPVTYGWMGAVRRGHAQLHRGLDIGVPSLVLRSHRTWFSRSHHAKTDTSDAVLDVRQIVRWSGCLGDAVTCLPVHGARHDVYLSNDEPRAEAYRLTAEWLDRWIP
ncbi:alpha/beta hydrolase [Aeromicrobium duanguangcaii]|uniref:alpha/beta hydrolase n=1 Tax=Aeromicrobium duanguangcaii TaxID=2968086 RepID=UPI002016B2B8|nr:alpha/beta hydrolase [Aeromicrobium duanguangcaii]MCL3838026.1 alpha/beta hydrolase [Aeromicrobium duanguangcaii]